MKAETISKTILKDLQEIKEELHYIKVHILDVDTIITQDDIESLQEADLDLKKGRTKRLN